MNQFNDAEEFHENADHGKTEMKSVSFRRTTKRSDGTLEIEAGEALLKVMSNLQMPDAPAHGGDGLAFCTGTSRAGTAAGEEQVLVGSNKAIENRATINLMLMQWIDPPKTVLLVEKSDDTPRGDEQEFGKRLSHRSVMEIERISRHCYETLRLQVLASGRLRREVPHLSYLKTYDEDSEDEEDLDLEHMRAARLPKSAEERREEIQRRLMAVDFVIALGHDGSIIASASLFGGPVPPVLPFALEVQGLMTRISSQESPDVISKIVGGGFRLGLRVRLQCTLRKREGDSKVLYALNDMVLDRGPSPFLTSVEAHCNDRLITLVQGDGLIVATPTGSTAYSRAAGGSLVHPDVPCILFTPLNPHSLSFRPLILPQDVELRLQLTKTARAPAWISFDGRQKQELRSGDVLTVKVAHWPVPIICQGSSTEDWLEGCAAFRTTLAQDYMRRFRLRPAL